VGDIVAENKDFGFRTLRTAASKEGRIGVSPAKAHIGKNVSSVQGDVANLDDLDRLYKAVKSEEGGLDIVIGNAGYVARNHIARSTENDRRGRGAGGGIR
jgi:NAD(P)-dependent dehydrogenase (short-subunit alcohol dehydrogenase family)